eukprot:NODE_304_length_10309_cov_0.478355.p5 type:complete len:248 gc:universal NODE_304_length_10309_cov_0.478355:229-972(+)
MTQNRFQGLQAGLLSGLLNSLLLQPFDVIRTRQQQSHGKFFHTVKTIYNQNLRNFYKGTVVTIYRNGAGYAAYFVALNQLQSTVGKGTLNNIFSGCMARFSVGLLFSPLTFLKSRFESSSYSYKSVRQAFESVYYKEGLKAFYTALGPTLYRDVFYSGLYFGSYSFLKEKKYPTYINATISALLGMVLTHPFDTIKTKMQIDPKNYQTLGSTIRKLSFTHLYSGFLPRSLRRVVQAIVAWTLFEKFE